MNYTRPYFTSLDPRARIRGSRDPLGLQPVWTAFGRRVISNITTVSSSVRNFTTLLLSRYFADRALEEGLVPTENYLSAFLRVEQLAAYSRVAAKDGGAEYDEDEIRGIQRVSKRILDGEIRISAREKWQILSDQKTYGLWGLYTVAGVASGLIEKDHSRLSPIARHFVEENYLPLLPDKGKGMLFYLGKNEREFSPRSKDKKLAGALADVLSPSLSNAERHFYTHHLLHAADEESLQKRLWDEIQALSSRKGFDLENPFSQPELTELIKRTSTNAPELSRRLEDIRRAEAYFAPLDFLFGFLLDRDRQTVADVAEEIATTWGNHPVAVEPSQFVDALSAVAEGFSEQFVNNLRELAQLLNRGDYQGLIKLIMSHNKLVMAERGAGEAWLSMSYGRIHVRLREQDPQLPKRQKVATLWKNTYFINAFKKVGYQIVRGDNR